MSTVEQKLSERGLSLPEVAKPVAAYVPAVVTGNFVQTSGQLPLVGGKLEVTGKVGAEVEADEAKKEAEKATSMPWPRSRLRSGISTALRASSR